MSLKEIIDGVKAGLRILVATDKFGETIQIAKERTPTHSACPVCNGTFQVGEEGAKVNCPRCVIVEEPRRPACPTCRGTGKVGAKSHQIPCPVCR